MAGHISWDGHCLGYDGWFLTTAFLVAENIHAKFKIFKIMCSKITHNTHLVSIFRISSIMVCKLDWYVVRTTTKQINI